LINYSHCFCLTGLGLPGLILFPHGLPIYSIKVWVEEIVIYCFPNLIKKLSLAIVCGCSVAERVLAKSGCTGALLKHQGYDNQAV